MDWKSRGRLGQLAAAGARAGPAPGVAPEAQRQAGAQVHSMQHALEAVGPHFALRAPLDGEGFAVRDAEARNDEVRRGEGAGVDGEVQAGEAKVALTDVVHLEEGLVIVLAEGEAAIEGRGNAMATGLLLLAVDGAPLVVVLAGLHHQDLITRYLKLISIDDMGIK